MSDAKVIVDKLWNYCNILRDDGLSYGDYVEQLTYLLFLKMAEEQRDLGQPRIVPEGLDWPSLLELKGERLEAHYIAILNDLGKDTDMLGVVFRKAQNRIQDPAKLERLIKDLIGNEQWMSLDADVKGDAYEGLLEKNAADTKSGAGQYFTPRALISAMVDVMQPGPNMRICDPACGTGGFFLAAFDYILKHHRLDPDQKRHSRSGLFTGWEIVDNTARLCAMNLLLHGVERPESDSPVHVDDALRTDPKDRFDMVLTNPPFGKKSSVTIVNGDGRPERQSMTVVRDDFLATTSNKQLNFLQHVKTLLHAHGRAAIVVPDNVLFEGGAGETIRKRLLDECDVHTLLRLPTGIFYAQGVKANVLFFDRRVGSGEAQTKELWIYDLRTNKHFTLKTNPLRRADLDDFVACYRPGEPRSKRVETERFRRFPYEELIARDKASLDIFWLRDESLEDTDNLPAPGVIAAEIVEDLEAALAEFTELADSLQRLGVDVDD